MRKKIILTIFFAFSDCSILFSGKELEISLFPVVGIIFNFLFFASFPIPKLSSSLLVKLSLFSFSNSLINSSLFKFSLFKLEKIG